MMILIDDKIAELLTENTGRHFLDSGGAYGRNWERNRGRDFAAEPAGNVEFYNHKGVLEILPELSVFHFLNDRLKYNPELDRQYREYVERGGDDLDVHSAEDFAGFIDGKGIYGDGSPFTINTFNAEDLLSQVLQYAYWTDDDGAHVLLQIHGGCDVRGGYTDPFAFDVEEETSIFDNARASIFCECGKHWEADNDCRWVPDGTYGPGYTRLEEYPATDDRPDYPSHLDSRQKRLPIDLPELSEPCAGVVWVDDDRNGHCPFCGGLLHVAPWPCG